MQIGVIPPSPFRMHTCIRLSCESRFGKVAGTSVVPCFEVTRSSAFGKTCARSTGAQSKPEQQSQGYQSCGHAGVAASTRDSDNHLMDMAESSNTGSTNSLPEPICFSASNDQAPSVLYGAPGSVSRDSQAVVAARTCQVCDMWRIILRVLIGRARR